MRVRTAKQKRKKPMKDFVREYIAQRIKDVETDPSLLTTGRITLSDVFYDLRDIMQDEGWEKWGWTHPKKRRRQVIQDDYIREVCKEFGVKRVDIGIIVAESAHLYFKGDKYAVGIDELEDLKSKGTDLLIIEKEGIAEQLRHLADPYGVARCIGPSAV